MSAIRLARGFTGRHRIIKFEGCYHGHADASWSRPGQARLPSANPTSAGVPPETAAHTLVLEYNNEAELGDCFEREGGEIAGVIVEPVAGNMNLVTPRPGFLRYLARGSARSTAPC